MGIFLSFKFKGRAIWPSPGSFRVMKEKEKEHTTYVHYKVQYQYLPLHSTFIKECGGDCENMIEKENKFNGWNSG